MGLLDRLGLSRKRFDTLSSSQKYIMNWGFDFDDPAGLEHGPMTRSEALQIPGVARAHHTIVSKGAQLELVADNGSGIDSTPQPTFLYRTDLGEAPETRMWCTFDDLYFYGSSLWACDRGSLGQLLGASWVPRDRWNVDALSNEVTIDGIVIPPSGYLFFNIPMWAGILLEGRRTLVGARDTELAWTARMRSPVNVIDLHVTDDGITQEEADAYVQAWARKHRAGAPAVGMTPPGITLTTHTNALGSADLFVEARDTVRNDIGSHSSLDGGMVDSSGGASSLTYETQEGQRSDFYEFDFPFFTLPVTARLSLDDVVPRGTNMLVRFRPIVAPDRSATEDQKETFKQATPGTADPAPATPAPDPEEADE